MGRIIYLPIEHIDMRYTAHFDRDIVEYLEKYKIEYIRIYPTPLSKDIKNGSFLDAATTINFKSKQIAMLSELYARNIIDDDDIIFCSDLWMPGIESVAYLNFFHQKKTRLRGVIHAGSWTDTDFTRKMERWASMFENAIFDIADKVFVASEFARQELESRRIIDKSKVIKTSFNLDFKELDKYKGKYSKENIVVFNGRNVAEKQPWMFFDMVQSSYLKGWKFVNTHKLNLSKDEYYKLLAKSRIVVSFALQENFGFGINEAVYLECLPILPDRLVYPEFYHKVFLYGDSFDSANLEKIFSAEDSWSKYRHLLPDFHYDESIYDDWFGE